MYRLKDKLWLWGQDAGSHHAAAGNKSWKLPGENRMGPAEGARYMGIKNICRVVMCGKPEPPFDSESEKLRDMDRVVWSAIGDSGSARNNTQTDIGEVLRQAEKFDNVEGAVLDDFFCDPGKNDGRSARQSVDVIGEMREKLHNFPQRKLELWMVLYKRELGFPVDDYLQLADVVMLWNMRASAEFAELEDDFGRMREKTPGKKRMNGCYMWNYGEGKPLTVAEIKAQCEKYYDWIKAGLSEGIIFCSNCCADLGLEAVEWVRNWIKEAGDDELPRT